MSYWVVQRRRADPEVRYRIGPFPSRELAERFVAQAILPPDQVQTVVVDLAVVPKTV